MRRLLDHIRAWGRQPATTDDIILATIVGVMLMFWFAGA